MRLKILLFLVAWVFLCTSCGSAKKVQKKNSKETLTTTTTEIDSPKIETNPAVFIDGGVHRKIFYVGLPNAIRVYVEGGNAEHLEVSVSGGDLRVIDAKKGKYSYKEKVKGIAVEVIAKDTTSGILLSEIFEVVDVPAPEAYVWTYRKMLKGQSSEFTVENFKAQNAIILQHTEPIPIRCNPSSYTVTHIDKNGKRASHENKTPDGLFDETTLAIISTVEKGDVFIVENIKTNCTPLPIKNLVYILK